MRSRFRCFLAMAMGLVFAPAIFHAAEVLRVAYEDKALPPYYLGNSFQIDPVNPGVSVELMHMAAAQLGLEIQAVRMPWVRCLISLQKGEVDAIFNASFKEDRQENGVYPMAGGKPDSTRRIATVAYSLYSPTTSPLTWDGKAVSGLSGFVGVPAGYSIADDLTKMGIKVEEAPDTISNFKKVSAGRIAAVATLDTTGDTLLATGQFPQLRKLQPPLVAKDYFVMFSHQYFDSHRAMAEKLWQKVGELRETKGPQLHAKYAQ